MKDITHYFSSPDKSPDGQVNCDTKNFEASKNNEIFDNIKGVKRKKAPNQSKNNRKRKKSELHKELLETPVSRDINDPKNVALEFTQVKDETNAINDSASDTSNVRKHLSDDETINDSNVKLVIEDSEDSDQSSKMRKYSNVKRKRVKKRVETIRLVSSKTVKSRVKQEKNCENKQNEGLSNTTGDANNPRKLNLCKLNITVSKQIRACNDVTVEITENKFLSEPKNVESTIYQNELMRTDNVNSNEVSTSVASDDSKSKSNLLSYFSKVPKVDVFSRAEKFEVRAVVHPPPFISSCRLTKEETNVKLCIKRKKSAETVIDTDKIEFVRTEILDVDNINFVNSDKGTNKEECSANKSWKMRIRLRDVSQESDMEDAESENTVPNTHLLKEDGKDITASPNQKTNAVLRKAKHRLAMVSPRQNVAIENDQQKVAKMMLKKAKSRLALHSTKQNLVSENSPAYEDKRADCPQFQQKTESKLTEPLPKQNVVNTFPIEKKVTRSSIKLNLPVETFDPDTIKPYTHIQRNKTSTEKNNVADMNKPGCVKLAPVFTQNIKKSNKTPDQYAICARNSFLQSGVPEVVKRMVDTQRIAQEQEERSLAFPVISHIQQKNIESFAWNLPDVVDTLKFEDTPTTNICISKWQLGSIINLSKSNIARSCKAVRPPLLQTFRKVLEEMKSDFPNFPIYRTFKKLYERNCEFKKKAMCTDLNSVNEKRKLGNNKLNNSGKEQLHNCTNCESNLIWTEKYKPLSCEEVLGNNASKRKIKKWLESWKLWSRGSTKAIKKKKKSDSSSDDDFLNFDSESESCSSSETPYTTVLLTGMYGRGKTAAVYAIANELGFKVIEINSSSKRTGKRILSKIQEATQSHQVQSSESTVSEMKKYLKQPKKKRKKKADYQKKSVQEKEEVNNKMSLILVEDADIVFEEQDEGFIGALSSLAAASKRPVILVANDGDCPHLAKFKDHHMQIKFEEFCIDELSIWLQLVCLVEGIRVDNSSIKTLLEYCKYDIRKCLLQLQIWVLSGGDNLLEYSSSSIQQSEPKTVIDLADESSNMSWSFEDAATSHTAVFLPVHRNCVQTLTNTNCISLKHNFPFKLDLDGIWWNLAPILNLPQVELRSIKEVTHLSLIKKKKNHSLDDDFLFYDSYDEICDQKEHSHFNKLGTMYKVGAGTEVKTNVTETSNFTDDLKDTKNNDSIPLNVLAELMDTLSCVDLISANINKNFYTYENKKLDRCPWQKNPETTNTLEQSKEQPQNLMTSSITQWLSENSILNCRSHLIELGQPIYDQTHPQEECRKWITEQHLLSTAVWDIVPVSHWLNRTAMAADYGSFLRNICRLEKIRFEKELKSSRRRNRFFHYLKELGTAASIDTCHAMSLLFQIK